MNDEIIQHVPLDKISFAKQVRENIDDAAIHGLAQSLKEIGQQQPIRLRPEGKQFIVLMGARRVTAAKLAGFSTIAAIVERGVLCESEILQRQFIENVQREDLAPLEKAAGIDRLIKETGWSATQTATKLGLSNAAVSRLLALLSLPEEIRAQVASGKISPSAATELARVKDSAQQAELAAQSASGQLNRDALSGVVKAKQKSPEGTPSVSRAVAQLGCGRCVIVTAPALQLDSLAAVLEELLSRVRQAKRKGLALPTFIKVLRDQAQPK